MAVDLPSKIKNIHESEAAENEMENFNRFFILIKQTVIQASTLISHSITSFISAFNLTSQKS